MLNVQLVNPWLHYVGKNSNLYLGLVDDTVVFWLDKVMAGSTSLGVTTLVVTLSGNSLGSSPASSEISS